MNLQKTGNGLKVHQWHKKGTGKLCCPEHETKIFKAGKQTRTRNHKQETGGSLAADNLLLTCQLLSGGDGRQDHDNLMDTFSIYLNQIPETPRLPSLDVEEQQLHPEVRLGDWNFGSP